MTTTKMPAAQVVGEMYRANLEGRFEDALSYVADDIRVEEPPFLPFGGTYEGLPEFQRLIAIIGDTLDFQTIDVERIFGDAERACAVVSCNLQASGVRRTFIEEWAVRDGKVFWARIYWFDPSLT
jgi:hypothetical protein